LHEAHEINNSVCPPTADQLSSSLNKHVVWLWSSRNDFIAGLTRSRATLS